MNSLVLSTLEKLREDARDGFVFDDSERIQIADARDWFVPCVETAGIEAGYTWHCNRHTFGSRLVMAGVDIRTVAALMGHRTIQMAMRYSHLAPDHQRAAVERLVSSGTNSHQNSHRTKRMFADQKRSSKTSC